MSVDPTLYDMEQDERISTVESYVTTTGSAPEGEEYSFPIPGQPLSDNQFQLLSLTSGNGIVDRGDYPYWLTGWPTTAETNAKNSMVLKAGGKGKAEGIVAGFYHVLTGDLTVNLPAVSTTTKYRVCLTYDPRENDPTKGPVSVQVYTTEPPSTFNRVSVVLYAVTRKPNQLLTDATVERFRPRLVAPIAVLQRSHLPSPSSVLFGSLAFIYGENDIVIARGASNEEGGPTRWDSLLDPEWTDLGDNNYYGWAGHGYKRGYRQVGSTVQLRGHIKRIDNSSFLRGGGSNTAGYAVLTLPSRLAPKQEQRFISATNNYSGNLLAVITVATDGNVYAATVLGDAVWISIDGIQFPLTD